MYVCMYVVCSLGENQNSSHSQMLGRANLPSVCAMIMLFAGINRRVTDDRPSGDGRTDSLALSVCQTVERLTKHGGTSKNTHSPRSVRRLLYTLADGNQSAMYNSLPFGDRNRETLIRAYIYL